MARGKFVAFIDADDVWTHGKLTEQLAIMEAIPELGMLCGTVRYWSSWNGGVDQIIRTGHVCNTVILAPEAALVLYPLGKAAAPCPSDLLLRREVGDLIGWFEESFTRLYEDQCFLIKVYLSAAIYSRIEVLCLNYRLHDDSLSSTVIRSGRYHEIRLDFLNWLETYLTGMPQPDLKVSAALHGVLSHYRTASDGNGPFCPAPFQQPGACGPTRRFNTGGQETAEAAGTLSKQCLIMLRPAIIKTRPTPRLGLSCSVARTVKRWARS